MLFFKFKNTFFLILKLITLFQYDYLFNNGPLPENFHLPNQENENEEPEFFEGSNDDEDSDEKKNKKSNEKAPNKRQKTSQYYRLKPAPKPNIHGPKEQQIYN